MVGGRWLMATEDAGHKPSTIDTEFSMFGFEKLDVSQYAVEYLGRHLQGDSIIS